MKLSDLDKVLTLRTEWNRTEGELFLKNSQFGPESFPLPEAIQELIDSHRDWIDDYYASRLQELGVEVGGTSR